MIDNSSYNKFYDMEMLPYKIISHLMTNNENIWKLLKYTDSDALDKPNLTLDEKGELIWNGQPDSEKYRVFMQPATDDSFIDMNSQLRIYPLNIHPQNRIYGSIDMAFEIFVSSKINQLNNFSTRATNILQQLLESLNGIDIGGLGVLYFDKMGSVFDEARTMIYNNKNTFGYVVVLSVNYGRVDY